MLGRPGKWKDGWNQGTRRQLQYSVVKITTASFSRPTALLAKPGVTAMPTLSHARVHRGMAGVVLHGFSTNMFLYFWSRILEILVLATAILRHVRESTRVSAAGQALKVCGGKGGIQMQHTMQLGQGSGDKQCRRKVCRGKISLLPDKLRR